MQSRHHLPHGAPPRLRRGARIKRATRNAEWTRVRRPRLWKFPADFPAVKPEQRLTDGKARPHSNVRGARAANPPALARSTLSILTNYTICMGIDIYAR